MKAPHLLLFLVVVIMVVVVVFIISGRSYGRAFLLIAMVQALALLLENMWDE